MSPHVHVISPYPKLPVVLLQLDRNNTHIFYFLKIYYKPAGTTFLQREFPFRVDWKAELKKPSPGPLNQTKQYMKYINRTCKGPN